MPRKKIAISDHWVGRHSRLGFPWLEAPTGRVIFALLSIVAAGEKYATEEKIIVEMPWGMAW